MKITPSIPAFSEAGQKLAAALDRECPEDRLAAVISECLSATTMCKNGTVIPDSRTRLAAANLALNYRIGKPLERSAVVTTTVNSDPDADLADRLKRSPALRRMIRRQLEDADDQP